MARKENSDTLANSSLQHTWYLHDGTPQRDPIFACMYFVHDFTLKSSSQTTSLLGAILWYKYLFVHMIKVSAMSLLRAQYKYVFVHHVHDVINISAIACILHFQYSSYCMISFSRNLRSAQWSPPVSHYPWSNPEVFASSVSLIEMICARVHNNCSQGSHSSQHSDNHT